MLTLEDCIALSDLTEEEIAAIAEHEHLPEIIAVELGYYLVHLSGGRRAIKTIIRDDIAAARSRGDYAQSAKLKLVLRHFVEHCRENPALGGGHGPMEADAGSPMKVRQAMSEDIETIRSDETIREAAQRMCAHGIGYFPVVDRGRLLGVITDRDIVCRAVGEDRDPNGTEVRDIMSTDVASCYDDEDLGKAIELMEQNRIRRLPVRDRTAHLVGILSLSDIARHAPQRLTAEILEAVSRDVPLTVTIRPAADGPH